MVVSVIVTHVYRYPVEVVTRTHLTKYPNQKERHVICVDTVERKYDSQSGIEYKRRIATCRNIIPQLLRKLNVLNIDKIYLEEECTIDTKRRTMHVTSRNMTWTEYARAKEESVYTPHNDNKNWTLFQQTGSIDIHGFGSFGRVLEMFARGFLIQGSRRALVIMEDILEERNSNTNFQQPQT